MKKITSVASTFILLAGFAVPAQADPRVETHADEITFNNPCAIFADPTGEHSTRRIQYGEDVDMTFSYTTVSDENQVWNLKLQGTGKGAESDLDYALLAEAAINLSSVGEDIDNLNFRVETKLSSSGNTNQTDARYPDAGLSFKLQLALTAEGDLDLPNIAISSSSFDFSCNQDSWIDLTKKSSSNNESGKGFGDPWNKYAWSMKDFNQKLYVGTKNAHYNYARLQDPTQEVSTCQTQLTGIIPSIYKGMACLELYDSNLEEPLAGAKSGDAGIWSMDYDSNLWTRNQGTGTSQGFRVMERHNGSLFAGSDLGSFIMGVDLGSRVVDGNVDKWSFPGSRLLVNNGDGNWTSVDCQPENPTVHDKPCTSSTTPIQNSALGDINVSFRALATHEGALYLGTFNFAGAELWKYDSTSDGNPWTRLAKFDAPAEPGDLPYSSTVSELKSFEGKLYVGLGFGPALSSSYLYTFDENEGVSVVPDLPNANGGSSVFKLFVSSDRELYVGIIDFNDGFNLHALKPSREIPWRAITENGFGNSSNIYAWSMAELKGEIFLGTFNGDILNPEVLPRGSAELWSSRNDGFSWRQKPTPLNFSPLNYGFRTMEVGQGNLYLGSASHILAPDVISEIPNLPGVFNIGAGAQVWEYGSGRPAEVFVGTITPERPKVAMTKVSLSSARISWPIVVWADEYEVILNGTKVATTSVSEFSYELNNLMENTEYLVSVVAINKGVRSPASEMKFRTNSRSSVKVSFNATNGKIDNASLTKLRSLIKSASGLKVVKMSISGQSAPTAKNSISKSIAQSRIRQLVSFMGKEGNEVTSGVQINVGKLLSKFFSKTFKIETEIQYQL